MADTFVPPGIVPGNTLSPLYVDGSPLTEINTALRLERDSLSRPVHEPNQRFWSSPRRLNGTTIQDVYEVDLSTKHIVNSITFELAHFPQKCEVQYFDAGTQAWSPVLNTKGRASVIVIGDSRPATISTLVPKQGHDHTFHAGPGHWVKYDLAVSPTEASRWRLVFSRQSGGVGPKRRGAEIPYPLGVRNFNIGYKVREKNDVPRTIDSRTTLTERDFFASTTDLLGSPVQFHFRENRPTDLLRGGRWKSEPMPIPHAVIPFYIDARDDQGEGQVVDRFYMEPLYKDVAVNIYFSNDDPATAFEANDAPLPYPTAAEVSGETLPTPTQNGLDFADVPAKLTINNEYLQFDPRDDFWMGFRITVHDTDDKTLFTSDGLSLTYTAGAWTWQCGSDVLTVPVTLDTSVGTTIIAGGGPSGLTLNVDGVEVTAVSATPPGRPAQYQIGTDASNTNFLLTSMVVKSVAVNDADTLAFLGDPRGFVLKPSDRSQASPNTDNSILRFSPSFLTDHTYYNKKGTGYLPGLNPTGLVGGPGDVYADLIWTPINRDYTLRRGFFYLPPTKAKFFKLEFTNLSPQTFETFVPMHRTVKTFTAAVVDRWRRLVARPNYSQPWGGHRTLGNLSRILRYSDGLSLPPSVTNNSGVSPTEVFYHEDPAVVAKLRSRNVNFGFHPVRKTVRVPRHVTVDRHVYEQIDVRHYTKMAYFVGLNALKMYRVDHTAEDDTDRYLDLFHDMSNIESCAWTFREGDLLSPPSPGAVVSQTLLSTRRVHAVQFATTQSPPTQLLTDPDFSRTDTNGDPDLSKWTNMGDAGALQITDAYNTDIGTAVVVQRFGTYDPVAGVVQPPPEVTTGPLTYQEVQDIYGDYAGIEAGGTTFTDMEAYDHTTIPDPVDTGQPYVPGGISSTEYILPTAGRLYAACRVITPTDLDATLWLQIIANDPSGPDTLNVLAEVEFTASPGAITEQYVGWDVEAPQPVTARLIQKAETGDSWVVDNISLYQDAIVWEFSRDGGANWFEVFDIRNNPNGIFVFPPLPSDDTTGGVQLKYRVTGYQAGLHLNAVCIRPWYDGLLSGMPHREETHNGGPNMNMQDHYMRIEDDPYFHQWAKPIPIDWWYFYKQTLFIQTDQAALPPAVPTGVFLTDDLPVFPPYDFSHSDWLVF